MLDKRFVVLDVYLLDTKGNIAGVLRDYGDEILKNNVTTIILILPLGNHPVEYIKKYITDKGFSIDSFEMLPGLFHNQFDSEPDREYMVLSFKVIVRESGKKIPCDKENKDIRWMTPKEFYSHPNLLPEMKKPEFRNLISKKPLFYKGQYCDSDGTGDVISWEEV